MSAVTPLADLAARASKQSGISMNFRLPVRTTDFDAGIAGLLHAALTGTARRDVLDGLCRHLATVLHLRLVLLAQRVESGTVTVEAASAENGLWLELQRIPERWDGGISSQGPAGRVLRSNAVVRMQMGDEGFGLWRASADAERVREILALPISDGQPRVLELYFGNDIAPGASSGTLTVEDLIRRVETFLIDLQAIEQQQLVARALACAGNATFITDLEGTILWSNRAFSALSGYSAEDVRGRNPSLLRSGEQGVRYYRELWGTIRAGEVWSGETVDRGKDGQTYTIHQTVSPVSHEGRITHYVSIHQDIGRQKKARIDLERATHKDPQTGLLTAAAFEDATRNALADAGEQPVAFVMVSLRGLQRAAPAMGEEMERLIAIAMGKRVRETIPPADLAGALGDFEYGLLLRGDVAEASIRSRLRTLGEKLAEPLPYIGPAPDLDMHCGMAIAPGKDSTLTDLRVRADRQLADEPYRRARRDVHH